MDRIWYGEVCSEPRVQSLVIGGAHPYELRLPASSQLDGSDPEAFLAALFKRLEIDPATVPPAVREELLANDFRALTAAQQDRPSLEDILPMMTIPCCLYVGDADPLYPKSSSAPSKSPGRSHSLWRGSTTVPRFEKQDSRCRTSSSFCTQ
jgi:hypothetical protein